MIKQMVNTAIVAAAAVLLTVSAYAQVQLQGDPKAAFIYLSPAHDGGWTESIERGRVILEEQTGLDIHFTEDVAEEKAKVLQIVDLYVQRGYNIIIGTSWGYGEALQEAAEKYPSVAFMNAAGETSAANLESFYARTYQAWYLAGMAAASATTTKKIGIVAGFPLSVVNWDINAFQRGAQAIDPEVQLVATFVNTWFDPVKEGQAAEAMIEQGVDVIATNLSAASVPAAAEKAGVRFVGFQNDMSALAPNGHLTSVVFHWASHLVPSVQAMIAGTWESPGSSFVGLDKGMIGLAPLSDAIPTEVRERIAAAEAAMRAGELTPFDGPVRKQDGTEVIAVGQSITDDQLWTMDYFVEGIIGTMPAGE